MAVLNHRTRSDFRWAQLGMLLLVSLALVLSPFNLSAAQAETLASYQGNAYELAQHTDPLKGMDMQELEAERKRLAGNKASPEVAALFSIVPSAGHFYAGHTTRGAWVLGGFAATLLVSFLGSYLLSSIDNDVARTAAVIVNVAPTTAYVAWTATDAYYQTVLSNDMINSRIRDITMKQKEYGYQSSTLLKIYF